MGSPASVFETHHLPPPEPRPSPLPKGMGFYYNCLVHRYDGLKVSQNLWLKSGCRIRTSEVVAGDFPGAVAACDDRKGTRTGGAAMLGEAESVEVCMDRKAFTLIELLV